MNRLLSIFTLGFLGGSAMNWFRNTRKTKPWCQYLTEDCWTDDCHRRKCDCFRHGSKFAETN
jgi:hypothetical protein